MTTINYNVIVQEFEKALAISRTTFPGNLIMTPEKYLLLKELYTVGLSLPRQMGTTIFIIEELIKNPKAYVVNINNDHSKISYNIVKEMIRAAADDGKINIRGYINFDLKPNIKELILSQPNLLDDFKQRVLTIKTLSSLIKEDTLMNKVMSRIYFDGSVPIFKSIKRMKYYEWLGKQSNEYIETWVIN